MFCCCFLFLLFFCHFSFLIYRWKKLCPISYPSSQPHPDQSATYSASVVTIKPQKYYWCIAYNTGISNYNSSIHFKMTTRSDNTCVTYWAQINENWHFKSIWKYLVIIIMILFIAITNFFWTSQSGTYTYIHKLIMCLVQMVLALHYLHQSTSVLFTVIITLWF